MYKMRIAGKERFKNFIAALPGDELREIITQGPFPLKLTCYNCNTSYNPHPELEALLPRF
jgi:redox-regulated HSP33 family molecular chaperone